MNAWIINKLKENIGENRYNHSMGVMKTAMDLAKLYNYDEDKASIAGLLHDCAKYDDKIYLLKRANDFDILLDIVMQLNPELVHGPLGSYIAEWEYNISDKEILDSIYYHTTGRENMTLLDKIIYISDYIEPSRKFPGVDHIRSMAYENLDMSLLMAMDNTIEFLLNRKKLIHLNTIKARNYLLSKTN